MRTLKVSQQASPLNNNMSNILGLDGKPMSKAYEGSSTSSRMGKWGADNTSPSGIDQSELGLLQRRSRDMVRNTPWAGRAITADTANEIGSGIVVKPDTPNAEFNSELKQLIADYAPHADSAGTLSIYGIQSLAVRARRESGEAFIRIRPRQINDGLPIPVQFQLIESDYCPASFTQQASNGNKIKSGIEFNAIGRIVAYWMYRDHPADGGNLADMVRVPAEQIIHHFIPLRPGQIRGVPSGVQAFVRSYTYDQFDDAELVRKKNRAQFTGVIQQPKLETEDDWMFNPITGEPITGDNIGSLNIEPGTFPSLLPEEEIVLFDGDKGGSNDQDFAKRQLLGIAAAYGTPYQIMTGDYSDVNDRVWRAIINQYRREIEQIQDLYTIQQVCRKMHNAIVDYAIMGGSIAIPPDFAERPHAYSRAIFQPQAWPFVHPLQDVNAMAKMKNEGFDSRQNIMARRGRDADIVDKQRQEDSQREQELGLIKERTGTK